MKDINEYQKFTESTAIYPSKGTMGGLVYAVLGLNGEAGEVAEKIKKAIRDDAGVISPHRRGELIRELGDVMWYAARIASELGYDLSTVLEANVQKLNSRKGRDTLQGSGDER